MLLIKQMFDRKNWPTIFVAATAIGFAILKLSTVTFRFSDGNAYFYMAQALLHGILPYRDYNLADPPFLILLFAPLKAIFANNLILFQFIPIVLDISTAVLIYKILRRNNVRLAFLAPLVYLFSFTVISTSDYVTGGEVTVFLITLAIYFDQQKKNVASAISWSLAILTKLYAVPPFIAYYLYKIVKRDYKAVLKITITGLIVAAIVLVPFILASPSHFFYDILLHQLNRPPGISKWAIFGTFFREEFVLIILAVIGMVISRNKQLIFQALLMLGFLLAYQDLYYVYLHALLPYMTIFGTVTFEYVYRKWGGKFVAAAVIVYILLLAIPTYSYFKDFEHQNIFSNSWDIAVAIRHSPENLPLYGTHEITPLLALIADRPIFGNYIDTNTQNFAALTLDKEKISNEAVEKGVYLVAKVADYPPQYSIPLQGYELYFDKDLFERYCTLYESFPSTAGDAYNKVNIYRCKK